MVARALEKLLTSECQRTLEMVVNIGSGNDLVPWGNNKPLPELMLTQIYVNHMVSNIFKKA